MRFLGFVCWFVFVFNNGISVLCQLLCFVFLVGECLFLQRSMAQFRLDLREMFRVGWVAQSVPLQLHTHELP